MGSVAHRLGLALASLTLLALTLAPVSTALAAGGQMRSAPEDTVREYFDGYFASQVSLKRFDARAVADPTDSVRLTQSFSDWENESRKALGTRWASERHDVRLDKVRFDGERATVLAVVDVDYRYAVSPEIESGTYNVAYQFELRHNGSKWRIVSVATDDDDFANFKAEVEAIRKVSGVRRMTDATSRVRANRSVRLRGLVAEMNTLGNAGAAPRKAASPVGDIAVASAYGYSKSNGSSYAQRFAQMATASRFFYTAGNDCTNFVSQCVWAGYGGYVATNDTTSKNNISNKVRMVPAASYSDSLGWQGGRVGGGGVANWETVGSFYTFVTKSKTNGPKGTGYNNGGKWSNLTSADTGNVLQFRNGSSGSYAHSVYVTLLAAGPPAPGQTWFNFTYCCYHSSDTKNRLVSEVINGFGGTNCYMRKATFSTANFAK